MARVRRGGSRKSRSRLEGSVRRGDVAVVSLHARLPRWPGAVLLVFGCGENRRRIRAVERNQRSRVERRRRRGWHGHPPSRGGSSASACVGAATSAVVRGGAARGEKTARSEVFAEPGSVARLNDVARAVVSAVCLCSAVAVAAAAPPATEPTTFV